MQTSHLKKEGYIIVHQCGCEYTWHLCRTNYMSNAILITMGLGNMNWTLNLSNIVFTDELGLWQNPGIHTSVEHVGSVLNFKSFKITEMIVAIEILNGSRFSFYICSYFYYEAYFDGSSWQLGSLPYSI